MSRTPSQRVAILLRALLLATLVLPNMLVRARAVETPAGPLPFDIKPLGGNAYAVIDKPDSMRLANAGFIIGDDGVAVIDTFVDAAAARQLLTQIRVLTSLPIKYVINTHYHLDHVAGNVVFAEVGAVVIAHRNVREWIHTENLKFFGANIKPEQKALVENLTAPTVVYDTNLELYLGKRRILVQSFPGHTGGDSVVSLPDAGVVYCGDLFWRRTVPNLIDASTADWIATVRKLEIANAVATFVPGHGDIGKAVDVHAFGTYLSDLRTLVESGSQRGLQGSSLVDAVLPELKQRYGDWSLFDYFVARNISDTASELAGGKRIPSHAAPIG